MGSTSLRSAASRSSFLLTRRRPQPKQPQHMFGWLSKKPLGCDLSVSASWPSSLLNLPNEAVDARGTFGPGVDGNLVQSRADESVVPDKSRGRPGVCRTVGSADVMAITK